MPSLRCSTRCVPSSFGPQLRAVVGQSKPRFDIRDVFTKSRILLVDCSKGALGSETSALLASLVIAQLWGATLARSADPSERVATQSAFYLDEYQDYPPLAHRPRRCPRPSPRSRRLVHPGKSVSAPTRPADALGRAANVQNRICFRLADEDARVMASPGSGLDPEDFATLGAYEVLRPARGRRLCPALVQRPVAAPDAPYSSDPAAIRSASRATYGRPRSEVEAEIRTLVTGGSAQEGRRPEPPPPFA